MLEFLLAVKGFTEVEIALAIVSVSLVLSLASNAVMYFKIKRLPKQLTSDARDVLNQIMSSSAVLEIKVLDKTTFFLRSPRG